MTQRRKLEQRLHSLGEIRNIINSMKTLAYNFNQGDKWKQAQKNLSIFCRRNWQ